MESTGLWDIKGSKRYIYAVFKNRPVEHYLWRREAKLTLDSDVPWRLSLLSDSN